MRDKLFARIREEGDVLVLWVEDVGEKEALLASSPAGSSPPRTTTATRWCWSARRVDVEELTELLTDAWFVQAPKKLADELAARLRGG